MSDTPPPSNSGSFASSLKGSEGASQARSALAGVLRGDVVLALGIILILVFMLIPIPTWMLDMGLSISILFSVFIMMLILSIQKPLEFSTFPTVLLIATSLRLGLNVASTRLILGEGHEGGDAAGHVIKAFGGLMDVLPKLPRALPWTLCQGNKWRLILTYPAAY